jgi:hypothetical protein
MRDDDMVQCMHDGDGGVGGDGGRITRSPRVQQTKNWLRVTGPILRSHVVGTSKVCIMWGSEFGCSDQTLSLLFFFLHSKAHNERPPFSITAATA